jgi:predicted signal transduction protein with EAL and GGDEF domain
LSESDHSHPGQHHDGDEGYGEHGLHHCTPPRALISTFVHLSKDLRPPQQGPRSPDPAEGVETTEQLDFLRDKEVDEVQGFVLARPLDPGSLETQILAPAQAVDGTARQAGCP